MRELIKSLQAVPEHEREQLDEAIARTEDRLGRLRAMRAALAAVEGIHVNGDATPRIEAVEAEIEPDDEPEQPPAKKASRRGRGKRRTRGETRLDQAKAFLRDHGPASKEEIAEHLGVKVTALNGVVSKTTGFKNPERGLWNV